MPEPARLRLGPQGRIVIPAEVRRALHLDTGSVLIATVEDGTLVLRSPDAMLASIQGRLKAATQGRSLVDELIAERREEARREETG